MDLKEVEKVVTKIQGQLFKNSNSYSIGMLMSHFRGSGLQFKEHQIYCHGDDVRFIDWKLYARTNTAYVKTFEEERNVEIIIVIDTSLGMFMGYKGLSKLQAAINIACLVSLLAKETGDTVQFVLLGESEVVLPKSSGKKAIIHLVSELRKIGIMKGNGVVDIAYRPKSIISRRKKFKSINMFIKKKKEVIILSDFNGFLINDDLVQLSKSRRAHCFRIIAPLDREGVCKMNIYGFDASMDPLLKPRVILFKAEGSKQGMLASIPANIKSIDIEKRYMEDFIKELV